jgi:hypothetical protein
MHSLETKMSKIRNQELEQKSQKLLYQKLDVLEEELQVLYHTITFDCQNLMILDMINSKGKEKEGSTKGGGRNLASKKPSDLVKIRGPQYQFFSSFHK